MNKNDLFRAFDNVDDDILERSEAACYDCKKKNRWMKLGGLAACLGLIFTMVLMTLPGAMTGEGDVVLPSSPDILGPAVGNHDNQSGTNPSNQVESNPAQTGDIRAEAWFTAEELGTAAPEGTVVSGLYVPGFVSYQGGFYGSVDTNQMDSLRFAPSEGESLLFNAYYTHNVYLVEGHPDWIAVHINGMEVYQKIFDVIFEVNGAAYAIAYSPIVSADYSLGDVVLKTENYTVYEAVKLQGEPAQTKEYIVDILPLLQRERPNLFDGSDLESGGDYADRWQLALPLE